MLIALDKWNIFDTPINHVKEKIWHLEEEEKEMKTPLTTKEATGRKKEREKIKDLMKYLLDLKISKEKIENKKS